MLTYDREPSLGAVIKFELLFPVLLAVTSLTILSGSAHFVENFVPIAVVINVTTRTGLL